MVRNLLIIMSLSVVSAIAFGAAFDPMKGGQALTQSFYAGDIDPLWKRFNGQMQEAIGGKEKLTAFAQRIQSQLGAEVEIVSEQVTPSGAYQVYQRIVRFENAPRPFQVVWSFAADGQVAGFFIKPAPGAAPTDYLDYQTKTELRLPFKGEWYVFWGGKKIENNYHAQTVDQRFAYDFLIMRDGQTFAGDGAQLEDYYCWGEPIVATGAGTVVAAVEQWPDNAPGEMDSEHPIGNHIIIDHDNGEYSFFAHLQRGSVVVEQGEQVAAGEKLALCGNSGHTSEPHLHYHMQTTATPFEGEGLPAQFQSYLANGEFVERGIPVKGTVVAPATQEDNR